MKKIRIITLIIALFVFLFTFCKNEEEPVSNAEDYMKVNICFEDWNDDTLTYDYPEEEFYTTNITQVYSGDTIFITGKDASGSPVFYIRLPNTIFDDDFYYYEMDGTSLISVEYYRNNFEYKSQVGVFEITDLNETDNRISGLFGFYHSRERLDSLFDVEDNEWDYWTTVEELEIVDGEFTSTYTQ